MCPFLSRADSLEDPIGPVPDPESAGYREIIKTSLDVGTLNYREVTRTRVDISAHRLVIRKGDRSLILERLNEVPNIAHLRIFADTVIVGSKLHLPDASVEIRTRRLEFVDEGDEAGCLDITPEAIPVAPPDVGKDGVDGLNAGEMRIYAATSVVPATNIIRFVLHGGGGQAAGPGHQGEPGKSMPPLDVDPDIPFPILKGATCSPEFFAANPGTIQSVVFHRERRGYADLTMGTEEFPGDGKNSVPGGKPGEGGSGGTLRAIQTFENAYDVGGGQAGSRARDYETGGAPGTPNPAYHSFCLPGKRTAVPHVAKEGSGAVSPSANAPDGPSGHFELEQDGLAWLSPRAVEIAIRYAEDVYLLRRYEEAHALLDSYAPALREWLARQHSPELEADRAQLAALSERAEVLLTQLNLALDYFGNPPGWVPFLSMELYQGMFERDLRQSLRALYLAAWLNRTIDDAHDRLLVLDAAIQTLRQQIQDSVGKYQELLDKEIPDLEDKLARIVNLHAYFTYQVTIRYQELLRMAENNVDERRRKAESRAALRTFTTILSLIPIGQPYIALVAIALEAVITDEDFGVAAQRAAKSFQSSREYAKDIDEFKKAFDKLDFSDFAKFKKSFEANEKELKEHGGGIAKHIQDELAELSKVVVPVDEVSAELERLKASDPTYNDLLKQLAELLVLKREYFEQLVRVRQMMLSTLENIGVQQRMLGAMAQEYGQKAPAYNPVLAATVRTYKRRSEDRLRDYYYSFARAFEYRLLTPYKVPFTMDATAKAIEEVAASAGITISDAQVESIGAVYRDALRQVAREVVRRFEKLGGQLELPRTVVLEPGELDTLNRGLELALDLRTRIDAAEDDQRIVDISVDRASADSKRGSVDIEIWHTGISRISWGTSTFVFRHLGNEGGRRLGWKSVYEADVNRVSPATRSKADVSLLEALTGSPGQNLDFFARPGLDAVVRLRTIPSPRTVQLTSLALTVKYSFAMRPS